MTDEPAARESEAIAHQALVRLGLIDAAERPRFERLTGGVSSDIWRVETRRGPVCVKRALPKLRVERDWFAPVERNAYEAGWMRVAARVVPDAVPALLGQDEAAGVLVMAHLDPASHALWKAQLRDGVAEPATAALVGERLVRIHAATAADPALAEDFATDRIFHEIRLEPYLLATAEGHADLGARLAELAGRTAQTRLALVHGDVSPKNLMIGPKGPVFLDAECAWYGDPAFDLAFCLNHLLLKCLWVPAAAAGYRACFEALTHAYLGGVDWEPPTALEARAASLLPGLMLGRVDGRSPVEYLTTDADKDRVRSFARAHLADPPTSLEALANAWRRHLTTA